MTRGERAGRRMTRGERRAISPEERARILSLDDEGRGRNEIARLTGRSWSSVTSVLAAAGRVHVGPPPSWAQVMAEAPFTTARRLAKRHGLSAQKVRGQCGRYAVRPMSERDAAWEERAQIRAAAATMTLRELQAAFVLGEMAVRRALGDVRPAPAEPGFGKGKQAALAADRSGAAFLVAWTSRTAAGRPVRLVSGASADDPGAPARLARLTGVDPARLRAGEVVEA